MRIGVLAGGIAALALLAADGAWAQRGVQVTPSGSARLISKDVGGERWAIRVDETDGTIVGNVYRADGGPPQFVWCWPQSTADDPVRLRCRGTTGCEAWVDLGEVELPGAFLAPPSACEAAAQDARPAPVAADAGVAASSTLRITPDGRRTLIAKDVGGLRWSVVYEPSTFLHAFDRHQGRLTGNVFDPAGGPPSFVSCEKVSAGADGNRFRCSGASACGCAPCKPAAWTKLPDVTLPTSFFEGRRCPATDVPPPGRVATLQPSAASDGSGFGRAMALGDTTAVVGVPGNALYIFERDAGGWQQTTRIASPSGSGDDEADSPFAASVALQGSTLLVSDGDRVRTYARGDGEWTGTGSFSPRAAQRVAIVASSPGAIVLLVGLSGDGQAVRVLEGSGSDWSEVVEITRPGERAREIFTAAAIADGTLAVSVAGSDSVFSPDSSVVYLYEHQSDAWTRTARIEDPKLDVNAFGSALALAGDTLVIGAPPPPAEREKRPDDGAAYVWQRGAAGWAQVATLTTCAADVGRFGSSVALSGDLLAVGAADFSDGGAAGGLYLFERTAGVWRESGRIDVTEAASSIPSPLPFSGMTLLAARPDAVDVLDVSSPDIAAPAGCLAPAAQVWPTDGWRVEDPTVHGMNPVLLEKVRAYALQPGKHTQGVVVVRHGVIVAEWYEQGRDASSYAASWSSAKSIASAVVGIALGDGILPRVDVPLADYFPEWRGDRRESITLRHALTMTSGLAWTEDYSTSPVLLSDLAILSSQIGDDLAYVLAKPSGSRAGAQYSYSSADSMLLSGVIQAALGRTLGDYAREVLFDPIGMSSAQWWTDAVGSTMSWCCVDAPTREFARFGLLYARNGRWGERQVVPAAWVRDSARAQLIGDASDVSMISYGYQWWLGLQDNYRYSAGALEALGFDGQYIYVFPGLDLVVVRNGHYDKDPGPPIADPTLFARYPAAGLGNGRGTVPPDSWDDELFLGRILDSIVE